jgi:hypothetical protein
MGNARTAACLLMAMIAGMTPMAKAQAGDPPNITGVWERYPDPYADEANIFMDLPPPAGGPKLREPYASQWTALREKRLAALKAGKPLLDASTLCLPEGMPTIMGATYAIEILQTQGQVTVLAEFLTQTRRIYLDTPLPAADDMAPSYNGYSSGHWEGDTLVIKTRGIRTDVQFFEIPHSGELTITERIKMTGHDLLENQVTMDDPDYLETPYTFTFGYRRNKDYRIMEYICDHPRDVIGPDGTVSMKLESAP